MVGDGFRDRVGVGAMGGGSYVSQSEPRWGRVWNLWRVRVSETTIQRIDRVTGLPTRHRPIREISFRGHDDLSSPVSLTPQPLFQWHVVVFVVYGHRLWWWSG